MISLVFLDAPTVDAQPNHAPKTSAEKFKNVWVLSDMPADQMGKVMNMMSASLGVNCSFCHEGTNFAKEGVGHKDAGRKMISMTLGLNKEFFGGKTEVTCNTCHQGKSKPVSNVELTQAKPIVRIHQPQFQPSADDILAKHIQAVGGKQKLDSIKNRHVIAKRREIHGGSEPEELWQTSNGLTRMVTQYGSVSVVEGFDGSQAWKRVNENAIELKPDEAEQIKLEAVIAFGSNMHTMYSEFAFQSADRIEDREVIVLSGLNPSKMPERLSFDSQTGLLRRRVLSVATLLGEFEYQVDYVEYQEFGGILQPTKIRFAVPNITWTREVTKIEINTEIDESIFRLR
ncbi:MAG: photosynthetic reaction center cytochrome c subunit family protein [Planctomycetota bacterium]|nr:photosynthetic reaction center cytochrome c subunit family protein [Planctomycetota bacterium]